MAQLGIAPLVALGAALPVGSALMTAVSNMFGSSKATEEFNKNIAQQKRTEVAQEEARIKALAQAQTQANLNVVLAASQEKRNQQVYILAAVGGVAVLIAGAFLIAGLKGSKPAAKGK
jgi:hypothetical protein